MSMSDPIADMLTRIRNANTAKHDTVEIPASKMKKAIADILLSEGYVKAVDIVEDGKFETIKITLKYGADKNEKIRKAVDEINKKAHNSEAVFGIHDATNRVTIKIIDKDTKKVLKEYPPEKTLDMIAKVWEMAGLLVDQKL